MPKSNKTDSFQLKADFLPITVLHFSRHEIDLFQAQLNGMIAKAPNYFSNAPIIVDFSEFDDSSEQPEVSKICALLKENNIQPIAARGCMDQNDLPVLPKRIQKNVSTPKKKISKKTREATKIITKPVRAGTQVYTKGGDLIVLSSVNAGAEVIADGNIHVYGPLRGRALAGANGDTTARIFCKTLEAELVAIAGHYLVNEKMKTPKSKQALLQVYLVNDQLQIETL